MGHFGWLLSGESAAESCPDAGDCSMPVLVLTHVAWGSLQHQKLSKIFSTSLSIEFRLKHFLNQVLDRTWQFTIPITMDLHHQEVQGVPVVIGG